MSRGRTTARRLVQSVLASHWMILPEWLNTFAAIADKLTANGEDALTPELVRQEIRQALATLNAGREKATNVALEYGEPLGESSRVTVRNGVAIVPVIGPLFHYASEFDDVCGCTSYASIAQSVAEIRQAHAGGRVDATLFEIDSPGGEVGGLAETAALVAQLSAEMPVAAAVTDLGASAAYYLTVAVGKGSVFTARAGLLGSIGTVATFRRKGPDGSGKIEIVSSQSPKKRPDVETEAGRAQIQATVDALADVFIADVAKYREVDRGIVLQEFGQGDVLVGELAVRRGMADAVKSMEEVFEDLVKEITIMPGTTTKTTAETPVIDRAYLDANHADLVRAIREEGHAAGFQAGRQDERVIEQARNEGRESERKRIRAIQALAEPGQDQLVATLIDEGVTEEKSAVRLLQDVKQRRQAKAQAMAGDEETIETLAAESAAGGTGASTQSAFDRAMAKARDMAAKSDGKLSVEQALDRVFAADTKLQEEYLKEVAGR